MRGENRTAEEKTGRWLRKRREFFDETRARVAERANERGVPDANKDKFGRWEREGVEPALHTRAIRCGYGFHSDMLVRNLWPARYPSPSPEVVHEPIERGFRRRLDYVKDLALRTADRAIDDAFMEPMLLELAPSQATSEGPAVHLGEEILLVLEGRGILEYRSPQQTETQRIELATLDLVHFKSSIPHRVVNEGREGGSPLRVLVVKSPPDRYSEGTFDDEESDRRDV